MSWKKASFKISTAQGIVTVSGWINAAGELGVHASARGRYNITHLNTGLMAGESLGNARDALDLAAKFERAGDWGFSSIHGWKQMDPDLPYKLKAITSGRRARVGGRGRVGDEETSRAIYMEREQ
jgi:hypothetical protein